MTANQIFQYHGNPISFHKGDNLMVNATQMAKPFNKSPKDFLKTEQSKRFIEALSEVKKILSSDLVKVTYGNNGGTWMHEDVALEFARWLSPAFAIWCNDRIKELLMNGTVSTGTTQTDYTCTESTQGRKDNLSGLLTEIEEELSESISMLQHKKDRISYLKYRFEREETLSEGTAQSQFEHRISRLEQMIQNYLSCDSGSVTPVNKNPETTTHPFYAKKDIPCYTVSEIRTRFRDAMLVRQMARTMSRENGIVVRTARLFDFLRREGWLLSTPECYNAPSEESTKRGLILAAHSSATGSGVKYYTPYITREGYEFFSRIIMQKGGYL
ncbi:KilA-N domain-containing protein [Phocaeicola plebeius]|uniref:KilA-N domain-containing protein n=1 Tax=Phocaeicola plebeius TaxID=310297 RepID=UPI0040275314